MYQVYQPLCHYLQTKRIVFKEVILHVLIIGQKTEKNYQVSLIVMHADKKIIQNNFSYSYILEPRVVMAVSIRDSLLLGLTSNESLIFSK